MPSTRPPRISAIAMRQPRFQRAVDAQSRADGFRPAHDAVGEGGLEHFGIVARQRGRRSLSRRRHLVEGARQRAALRAVERRRHAVGIASTARSAPRDDGGRIRRDRAACVAIEAFQRRQCRRKLRDQALAPDRARRRASCARGSARCSGEASPRFSLASSLAKPRKLLRQAGAHRRRPGAAQHAPAPASRSRAARRLAPRRAAAADVSAAPAASPAPAPRSAASAASRAKMPTGVSISASPPESSNGKFQRASAAITRRASARSGVTSAAERSSSCASRSATAIASASISELSAAITASSACRLAMRASTSGSLQPLMPVRGGGRRPQRLGGQQFAAVRRRRAERHARRGARCRDDPAAAHASRIADGSTTAAPASCPARPGGRRSATTPSSSRSVSSPGSTTAPCGSCAMAARKRAVAGIEPVEPAAITGPRGCAASRAASAVDQLVAPHRRFDPAVVPAERPATHSRAIFRKSSVSCQYWSSASGTRPSSAFQSTPRVAMSSISRARSVGERHASRPGRRPPAARRRDRRA